MALRLNVCSAVVVLASVVTLAMAAGETRKAASYKPGKGTGVDFQGTELLPKASGRAGVNNREGSVRVEANFRGLEPARNYGTEFMTYVLWAVTPEGRVSNIGELVLNGANAELKTSTEFQSFGMFVTAEPYFAVGAPSTKLILENVFPEKTNFPVELIDTQSELFTPMDYKAAGFEAMPVDPDVPSDVYQARNAIRIAKWQKADTFAPEAWTKAHDALQAAEMALTNKEGRKTVVAAARVAVQTAEDAKTMAMKKRAEEQAAAERRAADERLAAEQRASQEAEAQAKAEAEAQAKAAADQRAAMEQENAQAEAARMAAEGEAQRAKAAAAKLRADLMEQLNRVLETKDTPRGLVVSMAGVLFDTNKAELKPEAREKLAKLSGLMAANPTLQLEIEGHTDNTGTDETNAQLSLERAESVRGYLAGQGVPAGSMTAKGLGSSMPVADNAAPEGRQTNRRVEIIISGEAIGS